MRDKVSLCVRVAACVSLSAVWGCGAAAGLPQTGKVHGTVAYKGKPVSTGTVTFFPLEAKGEANRPAIGEISSDGSFELTTFNTGDGAVLGQHKAIVVAKTEGTVKAADDTIPSQLPSDLKKAAEQGPKALVPSNYMDPEKTPLRYTVQKGTNRFDLELKD
jgi:hypothetical protein